MLRLPHSVIEFLDLGVTACDSEGEAVAIFLQGEGAGASEQAILRTHIPNAADPSETLSVENIETDSASAALPSTDSVALNVATDAGPYSEDLPFRKDTNPAWADRSDKPLPDNRDSSAPSRIFLHDLALTMGAEAATVIVSLLLTSILSRWSGPRVLSEYLLLRRVLSWTMSGTLLGFATGLPRYVAHAAGRRERDEPAYFLAASICMIPAAVVAGGLMLLYRGSFAEWFFGNRQETGLVMALALLLLGYAIHHAVYGYYRGLLDMKRANLFALCNTALLPLVVILLLFRSQPIGAIMFALGGLMVVMGALFAVPILLKLHLRTRSRTLRARCGDLLEYSVPRVPGEFGSAALTALGPILAAHYMNIAQVSPLLLGLNMLMVIGYAAGPLGLLLLSKVSMMLGRNQHEEVQSRLRLLVVAVMEVSVFTCIQLAVFADVVVRAWVGPGFEDQMSVIRLVLLAIPPYLFFVALRSTIDAATVKPFNTANVLISLGVYLGLIAGWVMILHGQYLLLCIAGSLLGSQILLAALTARTFRRFYAVGIPWRKLGPSFVIAFVLGAVAITLRGLQSGPVPLLEVILVEAVLISIYLALLVKLGSRWVAYTWNVGICRRGDWPTNAEGL